LETVLWLLRFYRSLSECARPVR